MAHECGFPTDSGPCEFQISAGRERCFMHDSSGAPASHGAPTGNTNGAGNSGGGAPEGNWNAAKYHGWSDSLKHYHRLAGSPREKVDRFLDEYVEDYALVHRMDIEEVEANEKVMNGLRKLAAIHDQTARANGEVGKDGLIVEREVEFEDVDGETHTYTKRVTNPALEADFRLTQKRWDIRERLDFGLRESVEARKRQQQWEEAFGESDDASASANEPESGIEVTGGHADENQQESAEARSDQPTATAEATNTAPIVADGSGNVAETSAADRGESETTDDEQDLDLSRPEVPSTW
jgi:hypothetical protein